MYSQCITLVFIGLIAGSLAANCFGPASKLAISEFDAFPTPVDIGGTVYIRALLKLPYAMGSAKVSLSVYYTENMDVSKTLPIVTFPSMEFCNLSTSISCPYDKGDHVLNWEYRVPDILPGTYQVIYTILEDNPQDGQPYSCIQFPITVSGPKTNSYNSWFQATLLGTALFTNQDDYKARQIGEALQVGFAGPLNGSTLPVPNYGNVKFLSGSGDLVPNAYYDTSNFVWGLYGNMVSQAIGKKGQLSHIYEGTWYLGYINPNPLADPIGNYYDFMDPLLEGRFHLNWTYTDSVVAQINGYATFDSVATIPYGWGFPFVYGRLGQMTVETSDVGFLMVKGSVPFCFSGVCQTPPSGDSGKKGLASDKLGIAIGVPLGVLFLALLAGAVFFYYKKRKETEQEDGIFAASRKPEYGSALVVDGIIEETMGSKTMQAMLDMRDEDNDDSDSGSDRESDRDDRRGGRSRSRSRSRSLSRGRSGSRSARSESDAGESADRDSDSD